MWRYVEWQVCGVTGVGVREVTGVKVCGVTGVWGDGCGVV